MRPAPALALFAALAGCGGFPKDSAGTLDRVRGGEMRVGVAERPPWVRFEGERVGGVEPKLLEAWAQGLGARVRWVKGSTEDLVKALHRRELDVLAAGFDEKTAHAPQLAPTQPYLESEPRAPGETGKEKRVLAVIQGESAFLLELDRFLHGFGEDRIRRLADENRAPR